MSGKANTTRLYRVGDAQKTMYRLTEKETVQAETEDDLPF